MFVRQRGSVSLKQDLTVSNDALFGTLRLASIPATLPSLPHLITPFCARHPGVNVQVQSLSSIAIQRAMDDLEIDVGVTYLDNEPLKRVRWSPSLPRTSGERLAHVAAGEAGLHPFDRARRLRPRPAYPHRQRFAALRGGLDLERALKSALVPAARVD